jgi:hypothetical protein
MYPFERDGSPEADHDDPLIHGFSSLSNLLCWVRGKRLCFVTSDCWFSLDELLL